MCYKLAEERILQYNNHKHMVEGFLLDRCYRQAKHEEQLPIWSRSTNFFDQVSQDHQDWFCLVDYDVERK